jgi:hypothetical protein
VRNFATIAAPLSDLLKEDDPDLRKKKNRPIIWNARCQLAFLKLKQALTSKPVLAQADFKKPFVIETDASEWAIGCCLLQVGEDGKLHPVAYDGRKLQGAELRYPVQEKELLAIKHALRTWSYYIDNHTCTKVLTNHESLRYLKDTKVPSKRLTHWIAEFGTYDLDIQYRPGTQATVPDAISRRPDFMGRGQAHEDPQASSEDPQAQLNGIALRSVDEGEWEQAMIGYLRNGSLPEDDKLRRAILEDADHPPSSFELLKDSILFKKIGNVRAPYIAFGIRAPFLEHIHRKYGHLGWPGLNGVLKSRGWWPSLERDVKNQIAKCPECQVSKGAQQSQARGPSHTLERSDIELFEQWSLDLVGILPRTMRGNWWIITAIERSTGWPIARAVPDATSQTVMEFIHREIFSEYGIPSEILTDNGANLVSEAVQTFLKPTKLRHRTTTPYHPQTNGKVERFNGTIGKMSTKYLYGKPVQMWDDYLDQAVFAVRLRQHAIGRYSPFFLLYGIDPRLPEDPREPVSSEHEVRIEAILKRHDLANEARLTANKELVEKAIRAKLVKDHGTSTKPDIPVGSYVLVRDEAARKLRPKWYGPYRIVMAAPIGTYALEDKDGRIVRSLIHGNRLQLLQKENIDPATGTWKSSFERGKLDRLIEVVDHSAEMLADILDDGIPGYTYKELATISQKEWTDLLSKGLDKSKMGEGKVGDITVAQHIFEKLQARVRAKEKKEEKEAQKEEETTREEVSPPLPERISHTLEHLQTLQPPMATPLSAPPVQVDVPQSEIPEVIPDLPGQVVGQEQLQTEENQDVPAPVRMEAGRQEESVLEDLRPSSKDPPKEETQLQEQVWPIVRRPKQRTQPQTSSLEDRGTKTGYTLRPKPPKARPKEERAVISQKEDKNKSRNDFVRKQKLITTQSNND